MEIKVKIEAPEITAALIALASALQERSAGVVKAATVLENKKEEITPATPKEKENVTPAAPKEKENPPKTEETSKVEEPEKEITLVDVRTKLAGLPREKAKELITKFGASKLSEIPEEKYAELIKEAEGLS